MLAEQRRGLILDLLQRRGSVSVSDLHRDLRVSRETIRRDITRLAEEGKLRKTHGGALSAETVELGFDERMAENIEGKRALAGVAASLVPDGATVAIDSGTTTLCLAEHLMARHNLSVHTNDVHVAQRLANRNGNQVFLVGGEMQKDEGAMLGRDTTRALSHYVVDIAFIGACAISKEPWLLDYTREGAEWREALVLQARSAVLLADRTKFGRQAGFKVQGFEDIQRLVTDVRPAESYVAGFARFGIEVLSADAETV